MSIQIPQFLYWGRNSGGEECDRHIENDYYLTESEKKLNGTDLPDIRKCNFDF